MCFGLCVYGHFGDFTYEAILHIQHTNDLRLVQLIFLWSFSARSGAIQNDSERLWDHFTYGASYVELFRTTCAWCNCCLVIGSPGVKAACGRFGMSKDLQRYIRSYLTMRTLKPNGLMGVEYS